MKFYEVRHYDTNYPGRDKILAYKGTVLFRFNGKLLCYLKPLKNKSKGYENPEKPDIYLPIGFIVCRNDNLLYHQYYLATGFIDGLKNILGIKSKPKTENPFI
jgi:hypothetical protein